MISQIVIIDVHQRKEFKLHKPQFIFTVIQSHKEFICLLASELFQLIQYHIISRASITMNNMIKYIHLIIRFFLVLEQQLSLNINMQCSRPKDLQALEVIFCQCSLKVKLSEKLMLLEEVAMHVVTFQQINEF